ncbi:MAG: microviridin/marinostatin family tricyclic proteinase inhibitor [Planctomycetota bacterium]
MTQSNQPFFVRFLEGQAYPQVQADVKAGGGLHVTHKYPSDADEIVTHKYPSDDDEGGWETS